MVFAASTTWGQTWQNATEGFEQGIRQAPYMGLGIGGASVVTAGLVASGIALYDSSLFGEGIIECTQLIVKNSVITGVYMGVAAACGWVTISAAGWGID